MLEVYGAIFLPCAGIVVSNVFFRRRSLAWYTKLKKPDTATPLWAEGLIWIPEYVGLGLGSFIVYKLYGGFSGPAKLPLVIYGANLLSNWSTPILFWKFRNIKLAYCNAIVSLSTGIMVTHLFFTLNIAAGVSCVPYVWCCGYMVYLYRKLLRLNKESDK